MQIEKFISIQTFCKNYKLEFSFIETLNEYGLIEITTIDRVNYVSKSKINEIEKMIRLHHELGVNFEGIDIIHHLLKRVKNLSNEVNTLKNRIDFYKL